MKATRKATGLAVVLFSMTALIISGCSTDNRITAPGTENYPDINKGQTSLLNLPQSGNNLARAAVGDSDTESPRFTIFAKVQRIDIEGGCFYLKADDGNTYTPVAPKDLTLKEGIELKTKGYVDKDIAFFCGNGPAFVIEEYEITEEKQIPKNNDYGKGLITDDGSSEDRDPARVDEDRYRDDLSDREREYLEKKEYKEKNRPEVPSEERAPEMTYDDGNDRPRLPYEDRGLEDMGDRGQDEKSKVKEEQRPGDPWDNDENPGGPDDFFDPEIEKETRSF
ncbi:MAG: hypothetical protein JSW64_04490 [Candidatus Zixiibacteriota bacterium]|nr:MAG: hypothetical protein JSW64_04490 [candidate division Zixibacteria bacterium]